MVDNEFSHCMEGYTPSGGFSLPTTTLTFGAGCEIADRSTGFRFRNVGTPATPVWTMIPSMVAVPLTAAQLIAMYATPVNLIPAVPGKTIIVDSYELNMTTTSTVFTGGGVVAPQYAATANGAGTALTATVAASVVTATAGNSVTSRIPVVQSAIAQAGVGVFLSNQTAAFAAGTGSAVVTMTFHCV